MNYFYTTASYRQTLIVFFIVAKIYKNLGFKVLAKFCFTNVLKSNLLRAMSFEIIIIFLSLLLLASVCSSIDL